MLNRRSFVTAATGLGLQGALVGKGVLAETFLATKKLGVLGQFPSPPLAHEALHPISPDRVIVMTDWWLFLFPNGIEWEAMDDKPVFGMIAHVFSPHLESPGIKLRAWSLATCAGSNIMRSAGGLDWARIASLDRPLAAQLVNRSVLSAIELMARPVEASC